MIDFKASSTEAFEWEDMHPQVILMAIPVNEQQPYTNTCKAFQYAYIIYTNTKNHSVGEIPLYILEGTSMHFHKCISILHLILVRTWFWTTYITNCLQNKPNA